MSAEYADKLYWWTSTVPYTMFRQEVEALQAQRRISHAIWLLHELLLRVTTQIPFAADTQVRR